MPHSEHLKFKRTIVDSNWTLPPDRAHLEAVGAVATGAPRATVKLPSVGPSAPEPVTVAPEPVAAARESVSVAAAPVTVVNASAPFPSTPFATAQQVTIRMQPIVPQPSAPPPEVEFDTEPVIEVMEEPQAANQASKNTLPLRWANPQAIVREPVRRTLVHEVVEVPADADPRLAMLNGHAPEQIRAYRLLRHRLLSQGDPRVLAVTSAEPGEGKTTCAANLGLALADETLSRVLLIDANLRRPSLALAFGFEPSDSFMERLVAHRDVMPPYRVAAVAGTRLHIAALPRTRACTGHIDRLVLTAALHDLRAEYDYIVIDAAAVLESADADVAGECADGVIFAARAKSSRKSALRAAIEQISPARVFGTVLIDT